ncbi:MAG: formate dehydrogenase [Streptosporangiales bacterium]|nr:formate dehydrogenase [Streptosporangiales bacterium]
MANDIAVQFHHLPPDAAAKAIANHIRQFWERRMRQQLVEHVASGDVDDLDPLVVDAARLLDG